MENNTSARMEELRELVRECFAQTLMMDVSEIGDTADFIDDLGGDSLDSLDVAMRLEEVIGRSLPEDEFKDCRCVQDAARLIFALEQGEKTDEEISGG